MAARKMNPRSLENLKLGSIACTRGKVRSQITILPETKAWLARGGNISGMIDEMVANRLKNETASATDIEDLQREVQQLREELTDELQRKINILRR